MPKSGQRNSTVNPAAALQDRAVLELQLNGIQALSCIPLHSSTGEINPETEPAKRRVHTHQKWLFEVYHADPVGEETISLPAC